jgi:hypothetical protein
VVPGAGFEPATSGCRTLAPLQTPDYESGALARLGYPGTSCFPSLEAQLLPEFQFCLIKIFS